MPIPPGRIGITLGIDSGSTTTKIAAFDDRQQLLFTHYAPNNGNPIAAVGQGLRELLAAACRTAGADPVVEGSCVTATARISSKRPSDSTRASSRPSRITLPPKR